MGRRAQHAVAVTSGATLGVVLVLLLGGFGDPLSIGPRPAHSCECPVVSYLGFSDWEAPGTSGSGANTTYLYWINVASVGTRLVWSEIALSVLTSSGFVAEGPRSVLATNGSAQCEAAVYQFSISSWSVPGSGVCPGFPLGGSALVQAGARLTLQSDTDLSGGGYTFAVAGRGAFSGVTTINIP